MILMSWPSGLLLLLSMLARGWLALADGNCSFSPIYVPIRDVTLSTGNTMRGANLSVGNPPQYYAFQPLMQSNNTWLYNATGFCDKSWTDIGCTTRRGGQYLAEHSTTSKAGGPSALGANLFDNTTLGIKYDKASWVSDTLRFSEAITLQDFPLGVAGQDVFSATQISLGLGLNSTLLEALKRSGIVGSRLFSYWWGLAGATPGAQMDGSLILGGYDLAKIKDPSQNYTGTINPSITRTCPSGMVVTLEGMIMRFPNGSAPNVLDGHILQACLCPECAIGMTLATDPFYTLFERYSDTSFINRSLGINFFSMMYPANDVFVGNVEYQMPGLSVTVPNSQLVIPDLSIDTSSGKLVTNTTVRDVMFYALEDVNKNDIPRLGRTFFTSSVLMVDYHTNTFTLFAANPTTDTNIVSVTDDDLAASCSPSVATMGPTPTSSDITKPTSSSPSNNTTKTSSPMSVGAIAGIAVGAVVAVAIICLGFFYCVRRSRRTKPQEQGTVDSSFSEPLAISPRASLPKDPLEVFNGFHGHEVVGDPLPPQELWGQNTFPPPKQRADPIHEMG